MSSQSGIVPSDALVASFHAFTTSNDRAILLSIDPKTLSLDISKTISGTSNLNADLDSISEDVLDDVTCYYIVLKYKDDKSKFSFISYVPDNAIVKSKMLYASTKNTLLRSLGNDVVFDPILFINSKDELSSVGWEKIMKSLNDDVPLTESEMTLKNVKENELFLKSSNTKNGLTNHPGRQLVSDSSASLLFKLDDELESLILAGNNSSNNLLSLEISNESLRLSKLSSDMTLNVLVDKLEELSTSNIHPLYHIFTNSHNLNYFLLTCPSGSKVRDRMLYASNKQGLLTHLNSNGWKFEKVIEIGDPNELEISELKVNNNDSDDNSSTPSTNGSLRFAKPKGPKRR